MSESNSLHPTSDSGLAEQLTDTTIPPSDYPTVGDGDGDLDHLPPPPSTETQTTSPPSRSDYPTVGDGDGDLDNPSRPDTEDSPPQQPTTVEPEISTTTTSVVEGTAPPIATGIETTAPSVVSPQEAIPILGQESAAQPISEVAVPEKPPQTPNTDPLVTGGILGLGTLATGFAAWRIKRKNARK